MHIILRPHAPPRGLDVGVYDEDLRKFLPGHSFGGLRG